MSNVLAIAMWFQKNLTSNVRSAIKDTSLISIIIIIIIIKRAWCRLRKVRRGIGHCTKVRTGSQLENSKLRLSDAGESSRKDRGH